MHGNFWKKNMPVTPEPHKFVKFTPLKTNMTLDNQKFFTGDTSSNGLFFSIVILVFPGCINNIKKSISISIPNPEKTHQIGAFNCPANSRSIVKEMNLHDFKKKRLPNLKSNIQCTYYIYIYIYVYIYIHIIYPIGSMGLVYLPT